MKSIENSLTEFYENLRKRGEVLIYPQRKTSWDESINNRIECPEYDTYQGSDFRDAIEVMESLNQKPDLTEALEKMNSQGHSGMSHALTLKIITVFSKRGPEFHRACVHHISEEREDHLKAIEEENKLFLKQLSSKTK